MIRDRSGVEQRSAAGSARQRRVRHGPPLASPPTGQAEPNDGPAVGPELNEAHVRGEAPGVHALLREQLELPIQGIKRLYS